MLNTVTVGVLPPTGSNYENLITLQRSGGRKLTHEEVALQWVVSNGNGRNMALANSWWVTNVLK